MLGIEQLFRPQFRGVTRTLVASDGFANRTTIQSGTASVTVSASLVKSDSIIRVSAQVSSPAAAVVQSGGFLAVNSLVDGTSFAIAWASGQAVDQDVTAMWEIVRTSD